MTNLRSLDLNLMTVFEAVFEAGSITAAADRLALSASATSHAVARLRDTCRDDLFVRVGQGIAPTPIARRIFPGIKAALEALRSSIDEARGFDPATSTRHFDVAIPHPLGPSWALAIMKRTAAEAPGVVIRFDTRTLPGDAAERMRAGQLDMAVDGHPPADDRFVARRLFDDALLLIARKGHPRVRPGTAPEHLAEERFVRPHERPNPPAAIRDVLRVAEELSISWQLRVSEYLEVPFIVANSDLLGFIPRSLADAVLQPGTVEVIDTPIAAMPIPVHLVWHETRRADDGHKWLRDHVAAAVPKRD